MIKSPCQKICKLVRRKDQVEKFCLGCGRTQAEIRDWLIYTDTEKQAVIDRLKVK